MRTLRIALTILAGLLILAPVAASAQTSVSTTYGAREERKNNALEISLGINATQGFGYTATNGPDVENLGQAADLGIGWRINPHWMVGTFGTVGVFPTASSGHKATFTSSAGLQAQYHFGKGLPWIGLGTGWRGYWLDVDNGTEAYQGLELARLQVGFEVPVTPNFSIEPVIGASVATFLSAKPPAGAYADIGSRDVSWFLTAGALARFDLFGGGGARADVVATR